MIRNPASANSRASSSAAAARWQPLPQPPAEPTAAMRQRLQRTGQWNERQMAGRRWPIACVSLEITQRCNLDCTLCYLSEASQAVRDLPLAEVFRRIDLIRTHYGPGTDVQVSGGEPTLRRRDELVAIVRRLTACGLRSSLFTNGIKATRALLVELAAAGLTDVAFHVDTTQLRPGYATESELNAVRLEYIERARGLPIGVFFNTTVHDANLADVPMLAAFFKDHADVVRFASFQLQADTGRGVLGARDDAAVTAANVAARLQRGVGATLRFDALQTGHAACNRAAVLLVVGGKAYDAFDDAAFVGRFMRATAAHRIDRGTPARALRSLAAAGFSHPLLAARTLAWAAALAWKARRSLWAGRGRVHKLTFFIHDFMDARALDPERVDACVFMAITQHGPLSMCAYNARRDDYLLQPLQTRTGAWQPLADGAGRAQGVPVKWLRGRARERWLRERALERARAQPEAPA